jgi:hypothetical protein
MWWGIAAALFMVMAAAWPTRWRRLVPAAVSGALLALAGRNAMVLEQRPWLAAGIVGAAVLAASGVRAVRRCFDRSAEIWLVLGVLVVSLGLALADQRDIRWLAAGALVAAAIELVSRDTLVAGTVGMFVAALLWVASHDSVSAVELIAASAVVAFIGPIGWGLRIRQPSTTKRRWWLGAPWLVGAVVVGQWAPATRGVVAALGVVGAVTAASGGLVALSTRGWERAPSVDAA